MPTSKFDRIEDKIDKVIESLNNTNINLASVTTEVKLIHTTMTETQESNSKRFCDIEHKVSEDRATLDKATGMSMAIGFIAGILGLFATTKALGLW